MTTLPPLIEAIERQPGNQPDEVALIDGREQVTWAEFARRVAALPPSMLGRALRASSSGRAEVMPSRPDFDGLLVVSAMGRPLLVSRSA